MKRESPALRAHRDCIASHERRVVSAKFSSKVLFEKRLEGGGLVFWVVAREKGDRKEQGAWGRE